MVKEIRHMPSGMFKVPTRPITTTEEVSWLTQRSLDVAENLRQRLLSVTPNQREAVVRRVIERADSVVGVWNEPTDPLGVRLHFIKWSEASERFAALAKDNYEKAIGELEGTSMAAIPCINERQAIKLQRKLGNKPTLPFGPGELVIHCTGPDLLLILDGVTIAKRGHPNTRHAGTWVPVEPGYEILEGKERKDGGKELIVMHRGARVH